MAEEESSSGIVIRVVQEDDDPPTAEAEYPPPPRFFCCRICHEDGIGQELEAPCACSGTAKFAHRECIQRWCDVKGDTICEICQQKYEPDYTAAPSKKASPELMQRVVTISGSFEIPRGGEIIDMEDEDYDDQSAFLEAVDQQVSDCMSAAERSAAFCKTVAVMLTALLVLKQLVAVATGVQGYPFSLITVIALRVAGIVIPMYIIIRTLDKMRRSISRHNNHLHRLTILRPSSSYTYGSHHQQQQQLTQITIDLHHSR